ncbi:MAG: tetratricopeptide repeat protein [Ghiorsea sp.]|nr:tetratricopeptide repeat protein [Ghiorsea sp.]
MNNLDQSILLSAVEDYRFSDFDTAITSLEKLHQQYPSHLKTMRYLALSYKDNTQLNKAAQTFQAWLKAAHDVAPQNKRFALLGLANVERQRKNYDASIAALTTWLKIQPGDTKTRINLGDVQVRNKDYNDANDTWRTILKSADANDAEKAAAWYYKAWVAYLQGNMSSTKTFAHTSLTLDSKGMYATAAKQLMDAPPLKTTGFSATTDLGFFYNSNVELLPDILRTGDQGGDSGLQADIQFLWTLQDNSIHYTFSDTTHQERSEYDIMVHILGGSWAFSKWQLSPSLEYIALNKEKLYQAYALNIAYNQDNWGYHYAIKSKAYSDSYGNTNVNLSRLGGLTHNIGLSQSTDFQDIQANFTADIINEQTKGDITHDKTDDYTQLSLTAQLVYVGTSDLSLSSSIQTYTRKYAKADTTALLNPASNTSRSDTYLNIAASAIWKPLTDKDSSFIVDISYQKTNSNYDEATVNSLSIKSYDAWKTRISYSKQW